MKVIIEVIIRIEGNRGLSRGNFSVPTSDFKKDPNKAVAIEAYKWIRERWLKSGGRNLIIERVTWNNEHDITENVKRITPVIKDDLPF